MQPPILILPQDECLPQAEMPNKKETEEERRKREISEHQKYLANLRWAKATDKERKHQSDLMHKARYGKKRKKSK